MQPTLFIDVISLFVDWANKDVCLLAILGTDNR